MKRKQGKSVLNKAVVEVAVDGLVSICKQGTYTSSFSRRFVEHLKEEIGISGLELFDSKYARETYSIIKPSITTREVIKEVIESLITLTSASESAMRINLLSSRAALIEITHHVLTRRVFQLEGFRLDIL